MESVRFLEPMNTSRTLGYSNGSSRNHTERGLFGKVSRSYLLCIFFEDYILTNPTDFNQRLRSRIDYYNRIQPDFDGVGQHIFIFSHPFSPFRSIMMIPFKLFPFENYLQSHLDVVRII